MCAGLLNPLFRELENTGDLLACLAALQQISELATLHTAPAAVCRQICLRLLLLLHPGQDPALLAAALQASATVLKGATAQEASLFVQKIEPLLLVRACTKQQPLHPFTLSLLECKGMWHVARHSCGGGAAALQLPTATNCRCCLPHAVQTCCTCLLEQRHPQMPALRACI